MALLLAADIGGTKSDLAIFDLSQKPVDPPLRQKRYRNRDFLSFDEILTHFLTDTGTPEYGCFGVAAVVRRGTAELTNLDWVISEQELENTFAFQATTLINDLTAVCSSLPLLQEKDLLTIQQGQVEEHGVRAVIAPGTGLGEGFLIEQGSCFFPQGSEGGHCNFAPLNQEQVELLVHLQKDSAAVSYELLCSGKGIPNIFDFFASTGMPRDETRFKQIAEAEDRTVDIMAGALAEPLCPLCEKTLSVFLEILGSEAGNLALKNYATGGMFVGGGILPRIADRISFTPFLRTFRQKEKMESLMASIPVHLILRQDAALLGTAEYGRQYFSGA
jgi:glucokinase